MGVPLATHNAHAPFVHQRESRDLSHLSVDQQFIGEYAAKIEEVSRQLAGASCGGERRSVAPAA